MIKPRSHPINSATPQVTGPEPLISLVLGLARTDERPAKQGRTALTNGPLTGTTRGGKA